MTAKLKQISYILLLIQAMALLCCCCLGGVNMHYTAPNSMESGADIGSVAQSATFETTGDDVHTGKTEEELVTIVIFALGNACGTIGVILFIVTLVRHIIKRKKEIKKEQESVQIVENTEIADTSKAQITEDSQVTEDSQITTEQSEQSEVTKTEQ